MSKMMLFLCGIKLYNTTPNTQRPKIYQNIYCADFDKRKLWIPGTMDVTRAPVESQADWKPKSLLLFGFWFRLTLISQKLS